MVPKTDDGRVLFAIPWLDKVVVGTTDTPVTDHAAGAEAAGGGDLDFLLEHAARTWTRTRAALTCSAPSRGCARW
jgi:glycerol-3-phosphate dehydrogenase